MNIGITFNKLVSKDWFSQTRVWQLARREIFYSSVYRKGCRELWAYLELERDLLGIQYNLPDGINEYHLIDDLWDPSKHQDCSGFFHAWNVLLSCVYIYIAYFAALRGLVLTPGDLETPHGLFVAGIIASFVLAISIGIILLVHAIRFIVWLWKQMKELWKFVNRRCLERSRNENPANLLG